MRGRSLGLLDPPLPASHQRFLNSPRSWTHPCPGPPVHPGAAGPIPAMDPPLSNLGLLDPPCPGPTPVHPGAAGSAPVLAPQSGCGVTMEPESALRCSCYSRLLAVSAKRSKTEEITCNYAVITAGNAPLLLLLFLRGAQHSGYSTQM